jgi:hypothetical protein
MQGMEEFAKLVTGYSAALDAVQKTNDELRSATRRMIDARNEVLKTISVDATLCPVCMERPRVRALSCGHILCHTCAARMISQGRCPTCRSVVRSTMRVYI